MKKILRLDCNVEANTVTVNNCLEIRGIPIMEWTQQNVVASIFATTRELSVWMKVSAKSSKENNDLETIIEYCLPSKKPIKIQIPEYICNFKTALDCVKKSNLSDYNILNNAFSLQRH